MSGAPSPLREVNLFKLRAKINKGRLVFVCVMNLLVAWSMQRDGLLAYTYTVLLISWEGTLTKLFFFFSGMCLFGIMLFQCNSACGIISWEVAIEAIYVG